LASINHDLTLLHQPHPTHPDFVAQLRLLDVRRDEKIRLEGVGLDFKLVALSTKSVAERSIILSQYFQETRKIRDDTLSDLGEELYQIRRGWEELDIPGRRIFFLMSRLLKTWSYLPMLGDDRLASSEKYSDLATCNLECLFSDSLLTMYYLAFGIPFPQRRSEQIKKQTEYNLEVSILSGVAKYVGFPAAPAIAAAIPSELEDDLQKMGVRSTINIASIRHL
jgi:hypothetical protein